jgi:hypothetical protein
MSPPSDGGVDVDVGERSMVYCQEGADSMLPPPCAGVSGEVGACILVKC